MNIQVTIPDNHKVLKDFKIMYGIKDTNNLKVLKRMIKDYKETAESDFYHYNTTSAYEAANFYSLMLKIFNSAKIMED